MARIVAADDENILVAAEALKSGFLVAFPTETVYGLGADAENEKAVGRIYSVKGRPAFNPLISHYYIAGEAAKDAVFSDLAWELADKFWPGPLTLVLPVSENTRVCELARAGLRTIAVRVPSDPISRRLLKTFGNPVVAPSANVSGRLSSVTAQHVAAYFGEEISLILDGGASQEGLESTVLDLSGDEPVLLRPGTLTREKLSAAIKCEILCAKESPSLPKSPGMLLAHYAPRCPLRLSTDNPIAGEALLAFGGGEIPAGFFATENLSKTGDVVEAARNLFSALHRLEELGASRIAVMPIPEYGVGLAIMDRLRRAAV